MSASPVDAAAIRALIQSDNLQQLQESVAHFDVTFQQFEDTSQQHGQYCKLLLLLYNRILQLQSSSEEKIRTIHRISKLWNDIGEYQKSIAQLQKALDLATNDFPAEVVPTLQLIGDNYMDLSDYPASISSHQRAIDEISSRNESHGSGMALAHARLAAVCEASGDFERAERELQSAIGFLVSDDPPISASVYGQLGTLQYKMGTYSIAADSLQKSCDFYEAFEPDSRRAQDIKYLLQMASTLAV